MAYFRKRKDGGQFRRKKNMSSRETPLSDAKSVLLAGNKFQGFGLEVLEGARDALKVRGDKRTAIATRKAQNAVPMGKFKATIKRRKKQAAKSSIDRPKRKLKSNLRKYDVPVWMLILSEYPDEPLSIHELVEHLAGRGYQFTWDTVRAYRVRLNTLGWFEVVSWTDGESINPLSGLRIRKDVKHGLTDDGRLARAWACRVRARMATESGARPLLGTYPLWMAWAHVLVSEYAAELGLELQTAPERSRAELPEPRRPVRKRY